MSKRAGQGQWRLTERGRPVRSRETGQGQVASPGEVPVRVKGQLVSTGWQGHETGHVKRVTYMADQGLWSGSVSRPAKVRGPAVTLSLW